MTDSGRRGRSGDIGRAALTITLCNLVARVLGFVRVIATAGALGIAVLGDTYQRTNQVSNLLFELLAGGMLFAVLVPTFVSQIHSAAGRDVGRFAGALATRAAVGMGVVAVVGLLAARPLVELLTAGAPAESRDAQVALGVFLLWFVLPQLVLYVVGSVASAVLQADQRFVATSIAPALNSVVVTATMVAFASVHDTERGMDLTTGEKVLLGGGTLLGTTVMTVLPLIAAWRAGYGLRPRWALAAGELRPLLRRGLWAAGHVGLNQVLVLCTVVLLGQVEGGVIAYQTAFTFFLLPHALLAHPIFTALYPRLSRNGDAGESAAFAADLARGLRSMVALLLPAAVILASVAEPGLSLAQVGQLDAEGVRLVASGLAAYLVGVAGYSTFFLLTRASYSLGDARRPTIVNAWVTIATVIGLATASVAFEGRDLLVAFGLVTAAAGTVGSVALHRSVVGRLGRPVSVAGPILRSSAAAAVCAVVSFASVHLIGWDGRLRSTFAIGTASILGGAAYVTMLRLTGSPDLAPILRRGRTAWGRIG